jgi:hypothetical protein
MTSGKRQDEPAQSSDSPQAPLHRLVGTHLGKLGHGKGAKESVEEKEKNGGKLSGGMEKREHVVGKGRRKKAKAKKGFHPEIRISSRDTSSSRDT